MEVLNPLRPISWVAGRDRRRRGFRFNEFVLQRLHSLDAKTAAPPAPTVTGTRPTVLVRATHADHAISTQVALKLRDAGASPIILPIGVDETRERAMFARANHVIYCWGEAEEPAMFDALIASAVQGWRTENPKGRFAWSHFRR
ncbi:MAG: hypothetical protein WDN69_09555 [Aliidongia sp.]